MANTKPMKLINIAKRYKHIAPVPRMPNFAAWIEGVDLTKPLSKPVQAELRQALYDFEGRIQVRGATKINPVTGG